MTPAEIPSADAQHARDLTDRIKVGVEAVWHLITEAYTSRAWAALGYRNWDDYCTREFGTSRLRLPREERSEVVASLRESGLSIRAIEAATGVSRKTVIKDIREVQVVEIPPPGPRMFGIDLDEPDEEALLSATPDAALDALDAMADDALDSSASAFEIAGGMDNESAVAAATTEMIDRRADFVEAAADIGGPGWAEKLADAQGLIPANVKTVADQIRREESPRITGTDGKSYPAPAEQKKPNRRPITDSFRDATYDIGKRVGTLANLVSDDRFKKNADQLAERNLSELTRARDALQRVIDQLTA